MKFKFRSDPDISGSETNSLHVSDLQDTSQAVTIELPSGHVVGVSSDGIWVTNPEPQPPYEVSCIWKPPNVLAGAPGGNPASPATAIRPSREDLWQQANGFASRYSELLREHGYFLCPGDYGYEAASTAAVRPLAARGERDCPHENFAVRSEVNRLSETEGGPVTGFAADLTIWCSDCLTDFQWIGTESGLSPSQPMTSLDRRELRAPIRPVREIRVSLDSAFCATRKAAADFAASAHEKHGSPGEWLIQNLRIDVSAVKGMTHAFADELIENLYFCYFITFTEPSPAVLEAISTVLLRKPVLQDHVRVLRVLPPVPAQDGTSGTSGTTDSARVASDLIAGIDSALLSMPEDQTDKDIP